MPIAGVVVLAFVILSRFVTVSVVDVAAVIAGLNPDEGSSSWRTVVVSSRIYSVR